MINSIKKILNLIGDIETYNTCVFKTGESYWNISFYKDNTEYVIEINQLNNSIKIWPLTNNGKHQGSEIKYDIPESDRSEIYYLADILYQNCKEWTKFKYSNI